VVQRLMEEQYLKECWDASGLAGASSCADVHFGQVEGQLVASLEVPPLLFIAHGLHSSAGMLLLACM